MITRRGIVGAAALLLVPPRLRAQPLSPGDARLALADLERQHGGRLGVAILEGSGRPPVAHRGDERFAMCSTFKVLAAARVLARVDEGRERLDRRLVFAPDVILPYAPVTSRHVGAPGLSMGELCQAAVTLSDNTAANLLLASFGGPAALTSWLRTIDDPTTRLDNIEPVLNDVPPGAERDSTTPVAMAATLQRLLFGAVLADASRAELVRWMVGCQTGLTQLRAGVPDGWRVGDKTGSFRGVVNDVAVLWPPNGMTRVVTAYYVDGSGSDADRKAVLASVGRIASSL